LKATGTELFEVNFDIGARLKLIQFTYGVTKRFRTDGRCRQDARL